MENKIKVLRPQGGKPFRPAGLEPLFGFISTLQRSPARNLEALQQLPGLATLNFTLGTENFILYPGEYISGRKDQVTIWNSKLQDFELFEVKLEELFPWLKAKTKAVQQQDLRLKARIKRIFSNKARKEAKDA